MPMIPTTIDFSGATWWWPEGLVPAPHQYADFACDLDLAETPDQAWIAVTCGTFYTLWVDGVWIAQGPTREVAPWQYYDVIDLAPHLHAGRNRVRIRAHHLGMATQWHEPALAGVMLRGWVVAGAQELDLGDRLKWRAARDASHRASPPLHHGCQGWGEHVDCTIDPQAWLQSDADPAWRHPAVVAAHPLPGRERLIPEDGPRRSGETIAATFLHRMEEGGAGSASPCIGNAWQVWDFGRECSGFLMVDLIAAAPCVCDIRHGSLLVDGLPDHRAFGGDFRERLELPATPRRWESFAKITGRFVAFPAEVTVVAASIREHQMPLTEVWRASPAARSLTTEDHAIISAAARTVRLCCDDIVMDTPRRERAQYSDIVGYLPAFDLLFGNHEPARRWLRQYLRGADGAGVLRMCYPSPPGMSVIPDFSIGFARALHAYLRLTGDLDTVRLAFPSAVAGVEAFARHADADGLLANVPGWNFLCNSFELARFPRSAAMNALWADAWNHLADLAKMVGDGRAEKFREKGRVLRTAWRRLFWRDGRILDADSSPGHEQHRWWNFHYHAHIGRFAEGDVERDVFTLDLPWDGSAHPLTMAAHGTLRVLADGQEIWTGRNANAWGKPQPFEPWTVTVPAGTKRLRVEVGWSGVDWEVYLAGTGLGAAGQVSGPLGGGEAEMRPWRAPRWNQITAGYAIASGMLESEEAVAVLRTCVRSDYHLPWLKRTTPIIATPTADLKLIEDRAVLCNTPHSLQFFCLALAAHGMHEDARHLCRRLYGAQIAAGFTTLWEEFAPRSSICHAWAAQCVEWLLPGSEKA